MKKIYISDMRLDMTKISEELSEDGKLDYVQSWSKTV